ncbi:NAD(P)-binding protein [Stipitochalara longipes BDJ]|nr:NAD(P)-binding protein [Stipitochalara longipes BDJ]
MSSQSKEWILTGCSGLDDLKTRTVRTPPLGSFDVLVKMKALSLNHRDVVLALGLYPLPWTKDVVVGSDGSGEVIQVGEQVTKFKAGDRVATSFYQNHESGPLTVTAAQSALGSLKDGAFREYAVIPEQGLVPVPEGYTWRQAASLTCTAVTAWNALFGDKKTVAGDTVLIQGTGGVSLFALEFAKAVGATVIAVTSSDEKAKLLKVMGANEVVNYTEFPEWGSKVKELSKNGEGVDIILDIAGGKTLLQSLGSVKLGGVVTLIGIHDGFNPVEWPSILQILVHGCTVRAIAAGSRAQFQELVECINTHAIEPVLDNQVFQFNDMKAAYAYLLTKKHMGKIVIDVE